MAVGGTQKAETSRASARTLGKVAGAVTLVALVIRMTSLTGAIALLAAGTIGALVATRARRRAWRVEVPCTRCAQMVTEGMFCTYCGTRIEVDGPRLLEDLHIETTRRAHLMVPYGTRLPVAVTDDFTTAVDGQASAIIHLRAGEGGRTVARVWYPIERPASSGEPQLLITLTIDVLGAVEIRAVQTETTSADTAPPRPFRYRGFRVCVTPGRSTSAASRSPVPS